MEKSKDKKKAAERTGIVVFAGLMVLTLIEFVVSANPNAVVWLFIINLLKAALIVNYFMHVYRLWREESH